MTLVPIYLDGRRHMAEEGKNLLEVALTLGYDLPYFCWHPAMGSVGACRQCAVKQFWDDDSHEIVMSCMTPIKEGLRASIQDEEAVEFRRAVIELLMASHPHDCPVCDEGGECHLQDMTVMVGHIYRRYRFRKRTWRNQDLGPFVTHEMNRCIQCYRCTRFYNDYAGDHDFGVYGLRNHVYFGRCEDGPLRNEFSGNLVEVCPVGVFNDKTLAEHYTRKWDLQSAPSVCPHCGRGCTTFLGSRYGMVRRVLNRYNREVNGYFLCDRGRYGYQAVNGPERIDRVFLRDEAPEPVGGRPHLSLTAASRVSVQPGMLPGPVAPHSETLAGRSGNPESAAAAPARAGLGERAAAATPAEAGDRARVGAGSTQPYALLPQQPGESACAAPWELPPSAAANAIIARVAAALRSGHGVIGIGSPRASLEANYALRRMVGGQRFFAGMADGERELVDLALRIHGEGGLRSPTTSDLEQADLAIVLGEDVTNFAPMLALTIRRWLRVRPTPQEKELRVLPWNDAGVGDVKRSLSSVLWSATPAPTRLDEVTAGPLRAAPADIARAALALAHAFDRSLPVVEIADERQSAWVETLMYALMDAQRPIVISGTGCGSTDVMLAAAHLAQALPGCLGLSLLVPEANTMGHGLIGGRRLSEAFAAASSGDVEVAVVLENDLYRRAGAAEVRQFLESVPFVLALDHTLTPTVAGAAAVLPATPWAQSSGTFVNHEGRAQRFTVALVSCAQSRESWRWLALIMAAAGRSPEWEHLDDLLASLAADLPHLAKVRDVAPDASFRIGGQRIARQPRRFSGRTAMYAPANMVEPRPADDPDSPLAYSMEGLESEGARVQPPAGMLPRFWSPGWNSVQSLNKFQEEVAGLLRGGPAGVKLFAADRAADENGHVGPAAPVEGGEPAAKRPAGAAEEQDAEDVVTTGPRSTWLDPVSVPEAFTAAPDEYLVVPLYEIFGGEELSALAPAVAGRAPKPYLALGDEDLRLLFGDTGPERERLGTPQGSGAPPLGAASPGPAIRLPRTTSTLGAGPAGVPDVVGEPYPDEPAGGGTATESARYVRLDWGGYRARLRLRRLPGLPRGIAGIPVGLRDLPGLQPPFRARITPEGAPYA